MSITVGKLFGNGAILYKMKLIAGQKGINNLVEWVHIIEDDDVSKFLHGNEVVFTAGILNRGGDWLLDYTTRLYTVGISAFVVNIGPYTKSIPQDVIDYCNEVNLPLYTIPWETRMVDITRDVCSRIIKREQVELTIADTIKNIVFKIGDIETHILQMERYGYLRDSNFCFVVMSFDNSSNTGEKPSISKIKMYSEKIARSIHELYVSFQYNDSLVLLLVNYGNYDVDNFVTTFFKNDKDLSVNIYMGISENKAGINVQAENFNNALRAMTLARKKQCDRIYYNELDIYKLLLNIQGKDIIKDYYDNTIGKIEKYDAENNTGLVAFLRMYLENNGSQSSVAQQQYIHRNTVTNQIKKIEKITGCNLLNLEQKVKFYLGFMVKDIL